MFGRQMRVTIADRAGDAKSVSNLFDSLPHPHIEFSTERTHERKSNKATVTIFNADLMLRQFLDREAELFVQIEVGYARPHDTGLQVLFTGDLIDVTHTHDGTSQSTQLDCGDAERRLRDTRVSFSLPTSTTTRLVMAELARQMETPLGFVSPALLDHQYLTGYAYHGYARDALSELMPPGFMWSVQDGTLIVIEDTEGVGVPTILLTPETGLIGIPTRKTVERRRRGRGQATGRRRKKKNGIAFSCFLRPDLRPGVPVVVIEDRISLIRNTYILTSVSAKGGSDAGDNWQMDCDAIEKAQPVDEQPDAAPAPNTPNTDQQNEEEADYSPVDGEVNYESADGEEDSTTTSQEEVLWSE